MSSLAVANHPLRGGLGCEAGPWRNGMRRRGAFSKTECLCRECSYAFALSRRTWFSLNNPKLPKSSGQTLCGVRIAKQRFPEGARAPLPRSTTRTSENFQLQSGAASPHPTTLPRILICIRQREASWSAELPRRFSSGANTFHTSQAAAGEDARAPPVDRPRAFHRAWDARNDSVGA